MTPLEPAAAWALAAVAGLYGLVIGSFLNVVVYRVPAGISLLRESRCPRCAAAVRWWHNVPLLSWLALHGRCAACSEPISPRYPAVEAGTAVAFAIVGWFLPASTAWAGVGATGTGSGPWSMPLVLAAFWWFAASSIALALIDHDVRRLPDQIVLPGYVVGTVLLTLACVLGADWWALLRAGAGMAVLASAYFGLSLVRPGGMGLGDVKLAGLVGLHLGWLGWGQLAVGGVAAFLLGGVYGVFLVSTKRAGRKASIAFGPWILVGAWVGVLAGSAVARLYGGLYGLS